MDPVAQSCEQAIGTWALPSSSVRTARGIKLEASERPSGGASPAAAGQRGHRGRVLCRGTRPPKFDGHPTSSRSPVAIRDLDDAGLVKLAKEGDLFLTLAEMKAIQEYFRASREPTDIELETIAQTWSEHCVHKTLQERGRRVKSATGRASPSGNSTT